MTVQQAVELARRHHQAGQLQQAEMLYREILAVQPDQPDAIHLLGVLAFQSGQPDVALDLLQRATAINPHESTTFSNLARVLCAVGRRDEAIHAYRKSIALEPTNPETHNNLANALSIIGVLDEAINEYRQAIALKHDFAEAYSNLGNALRAQGKIDASIAALRCALKIRPRLPDAQHNLGLSLKESGQLEAAAREFRAALESRPSYPEAWNNLGSVLQEQGQSQEAIGAFRHALGLRPEFPEALVNLGNTLRSIGQVDESIGIIRQALQLKPNYACGLNSLGCSLHSAGRFDEAMSAYREAMHFKPEWEIPHCNLGFTQLLKGDFENGWREHEHRIRSPKLDGRQLFSIPMWDGSDLAGKRIVLHGEQGFGDVIQFSRYAPLVAARGGRVIIRCQPELVGLMKHIKGVESAMSTQCIIPADVTLHCPLMSLPLVFGTQLGSIPAEVPYLSAGEEKRSAWRMQLASLGKQLKVGLVWAGRTTYLNDRYRSMSLAAFAPLAAVPGVSFISLQKGDASSQSQSVPAISLTDWTSQLKSFEDTAALIAELDLVIAVDTAVAHLAAAMGKQVWVLLPLIPDWRWMLDRTDSPWYPTMRLFRQSGVGDWQTPIAEIASALRAQLPATQVAE